MGAGLVVLPLGKQAPTGPLCPGRSASLAQVNAMLREQLDQAGSANQALSEDIRKVTSDWTRSCKELEQREAAWRREEEVRGGSLMGKGRLGSAGMVRAGVGAEVSRGHCSHCRDLRDIFLFCFVFGTRD